MTPQERCNREADSNYFGACPECGSHDGYVNIGRGHWYFCKEHRTRWCAGWNNTQREALMMQGSAQLSVDPCQGHTVATP